MKAIVVGRHAPDFGGQDVEVVEQANVTFPATARECEAALIRLAAQAQERNAALLFQNTPGQVAVALARLAAEAEAVEYSPAEQRPGVMGFKPEARRVGVIINTPSPAPMGPEVEEFSFAPYAEHDPSLLAAEAVRFANPRADTDTRDPYTLRVSVQPPRPFVYSHIEWL